MSTIQELLAQREQLQAISDSAALDVELLLCHCLDRPRSYLFTWPEREVPADIEQHFQQLLERRAVGEPIAYLTGRREFWSLDLAVEPCTLIPRPDTERLVEVALELLPAPTAEVLDLGTGSGAIALALASERPGWQVLGVDIDADSVRLARANAQRLGLDNAYFEFSDWFAALAPWRYDLIISNPPYIDAGDPHLATGDVRFEPRRALVAKRQGLAAIAVIAGGAGRFLQPRAWLLFEHGADQGPAVRALLANAGFSDVATWNDYGDRERVTGGRAP